MHDLNNLKLLVNVIIYKDDILDQEGSRSQNKRFQYYVIDSDCDEKVLNE